MYVDKMCFPLTKVLSAALPALLFFACSSVEISHNTAPLSRHHLPNGHFENTDDSCPPIRDTMEADSLVPKFRTRMYRLPIVRGNEDLWQDSTASSAAWIGHSTYYIQWRGYGILTDPMFSTYSSPIQLVGPKRGTPPGRSLDSLPNVNLVIVSHDHYDHLDRTSIVKIFNRWNHVKFAVPLKVAAILESWGIPSKNIIELDWWESAVAGPLKLTFVPAHHTSRRGIFASSAKSTLWGGWILERPTEDSLHTTKMWFGGDLAMGDGSYYKEIAERFAPIDVSFLPIGSYKPSRYTRVHASPRQAAQLHLLTKSKFSLAMHWGTFGFVYDRLEDPPKDLARAKKELGIPDSAFYVPKHGEIVPLFR